MAQSTRWRLCAHMDCCCRRACGKWLPENDLAYVVSDVIDQLDLSARDEVYGSEKRGQPPYDPRMMTKLLVYGYCVGMFSSRQITRACAAVYRRGLGHESPHPPPHSPLHLRRQIFDLRTEMLSFLFIRSEFIALYLLALALIFAPRALPGPLSTHALPARSSEPARRVPPSSSNGSCRKSDMVRKFG
jgi:hypothetical protein